MKHFYLAILIALSAALTTCPLRAQDRENVISGDFQNLTFSEFIQKVEAQTSYYFYYDKNQFDSLSVTLKAERQTLSSILDSLFKETKFYHLITESGKVYLTKGREIRDQLPVGFFDSKAGPEDFDIAMFDLMHNVDEKKRLTEEERLFEIGPRSKIIKNAKATLSGYIRNTATGEPVAGAVIFNQTTSQGVATDPMGYYFFEIPTGKNVLKISCVGMAETTRQLMVYSNGKFDIELKEKVTALREVVVESERGANISGTQMGMTKLDMKTMKQVPVAFGEADVLKVVLTLPGVQTVGESSTGLNVRGGTSDQNLILFDGATIFNSSHLFGFFSAFNPDVVKSVELYKSGVPAEYGGRLSSVMEVASREGNKKKFGGSGGIGLVTGRLTLEGPIKKDKTSFLIGGRSTYSDWLLSRIPEESIQNSDGSFYDLNLHLNHEANERNSFDLTGYYSNDKFKLNSDTLYRYNNLNATFKWKHSFNKKIYGVLTGSFSQYKFSISSEQNPVEAFDLNSRIDQINAAADFSYYMNDKHTLTFGGSVIHYALNPGDLQPLGEESLQKPNFIEDEQAFESALYISDKYELSSRLSLYAGLRFSFYQYMGPKTIYQYTPGLPREDDNIVDTVAYSSGKIISSYSGPEYRLSARYMLSETSSFKFSYQRMRQYIHMLSNTVAVAPTNIWKLSDPYIRPQLGDQVSIGYYKNFRANTIEFSAEAYYKTMKDFLDYKGGAVLLLNENIETDVLSTKGSAYGLELLLKKVTGKVNGWVSYTYSRSFLQTSLSEISEAVNRGEVYRSNFDKPHDFTVIGNYKFSRRFNVAVNYTYSTGRPLTVPLAKYFVDGSMRLYYSDRNQFRIPDYYRLDFALNFEGNHKVRKLAHSSWTFSVYNVTGRRNAYSVYFKSEEGVIKGYKMSIFGEPIPTITYNFKF